MQGRMSWLCNPTTSIFIHRLSLQYTVLGICRVFLAYSPAFLVPLIGFSRLDAERESERAIRVACEPAPEPDALAISRQPGRKANNILYVQRTYELEDLL